MQTKLCLQGIPWVDMEHGRTFNNCEILVEIRDKFLDLIKGLWEVQWPLCYHAGL